MKTLLILLIVACNSCTYPPRAIVTYHGNYGDYSYSAKSGFVANLRNLATPEIEITKDK